CARGGSSFYYFDYW
nr:immunoglobulin heavy chain junction region [Mus musculus]